MQYRPTPCNPHTLTPERVEQYLSVLPTVFIAPLQLHHKELEEYMEAVDPADQKPHLVRLYKAIDNELKDRGH